MNCTPMQRAAAGCGVVHATFARDDGILETTVAPRAVPDLRLLDVAGYPGLGQSSPRPARLRLPRHLPRRPDRHGLHRVMDLGGADAVRLLAERPFQPGAIAM